MWLELLLLPASIYAQRPWVRWMKILCGDSFSFLTLSPPPPTFKKGDVNQTPGSEQSLHLASLRSQYLPCSHCLGDIALSALNGCRKVRCSEGNTLPIPQDPAAFSPVNRSVMGVDTGLKNLEFPL